jgi:hypothetical protein
MVNGRSLTVDGEAVEPVRAVPAALPMARTWAFFQVDLFRSSAFTATVKRRPQL